MAFIQKFKLQTNVKDFYSFRWEWFSFVLVLDYMNVPTQTSKDDKSNVACYNKTLCV